MALLHPLLVELGRILAEHRERLHLEPRAVENNPRLRWYPGKCSRIEGGIRTLEPAELFVLADLYQVTDDTRDEMLALSEAGGRKEPIPDIPERARPLVLLERYAHAFDYYDETLWPAVVAHPSYTRELIMRGVRDRQADEDPQEYERTVVAEAEARIAARAARANVLTKDNPLKVRLLLGMGAVHRLPETADPHLEHVLKLVESGAVSIRFVPFEYGLHPLQGNACNLFHFHWPRRVSTQLYLEAASRSDLIADPGEVDVYKRRFDRLYDAAPDESESARILRERIQQLRTRRRNDDPSMGSA